MHCSAHTKKLINIKVKKLLILSLEHTYTINYSCQIIESVYLQYLGYTTLTVKSQELYLGVLKRLTLSYGNSWNF